MKLEIRQATPEEMDEFRYVVKSALMMIAPEHLSSEQTFCAFVDGKLATSYAAWDLSIKLNGGTIPMSGITDVGTRPVNRRSGLLRKVTQTHFEKLHEEGKQPLSGLYASRAAIYRRYGYSPVVTNCSYTIEPRFLQFAAGKEPTGTIQEIGKDDATVFAKLYDRFIEPRTGYLLRTEDMWKRRLNQPPREHFENFNIIYEENGTPQGYVMYNAELIQEGPNRWNQNIVIRDMVWNTPSALRGLWEFFSNMDVIVDIRRKGVPDDDPLPFLLLEPRKLEKTSRDGLLARIIDVQQIMDKREYAAEGKLTFKVLDDMCPWNEGTWNLETSPDGASIEKTDETPQITLPLSTLTLLFFGQISATEAWRMGRLDTDNRTALATWDNIMKTAYRPACADDF